ncbi:MAG: DUF4097 domain-containing protein [Lachnospiraceae bacterium]|nr:DUF4097 domain-containing protein [Lachnospiraceae bacterium]
MSKFAKSSLIAAGVFATLGVVLCLISAVFGGRNLIYYVKNDAYMEERFEKVGDALEYIFGRRHTAWLYDENPQELTVNHNEVAGDNAMEAHLAIDGVRNLDLSLGAGSFVLRKKDVDDGVIDIYIQGKGGCDYVVKGDTLYVEGFKGIKTLGTDLSENVITLLLPGGTWLEEVDIEVGAGVMEIVSLDAGEIDAVIGAGELRIEKARTRELSAEIGAGRMEARNMETMNADLTLSMGECIYEGTADGNLDVECDMGNMVLYLKGDEKDFNYDIECGVGHVTIGERSYTALGLEKSIHNGGHREFEIECNMGNVDVFFFSDEGIQ